MSELMDQIRQRGLDEQDKMDLLKNPVTHDMMVGLERLLEVSTKLEPTEQRMGTGGNIWELATAESKRKAAKSLEDVATIYILGSDRGAKTTLLNVFLDKKDPSIEQKTLGLDFSFARRVNTALEKEVCHFWELGGDARDWTSLIPLPVIGCHTWNRLTVFITLDLSQPLGLWATLETVLSGIRSGLQEGLGKLDKSTALTVAQGLEAKMKSRLENVPEEDRQHLNPFHLPVVLIGTKFDLFQNLEPETIKTVTRILRLAAHILGATLVYHTREDYKLKRRFRELVSHFAFNTKFPKDTCFEPGDCLFIPAGTDSFEKIWPAQKSSQCTLAFCKSHYESKVGKDVERGEEKVPNPADDPRFAEGPIDRLRAKCLEELEYSTE